MELIPGRPTGGIYGQRMDASADESVLRVERTSEGDCGPLTVVGPRWLASEAERS